MKILIGSSARWALAHRRSVAACLLLALLIVLGAQPSARASDVYNNIGPAPQIPPGGWFGRYPLNNYSLDQYFPAISVGFTSGVDASGVAPMIAYFGAQVIWQITSFLATGVILLFGLAFNLDLVNGDGTPGSGALTPVSQAIHNLYASTFGAPWLIAMVVLVGCWAMWKALIQRRYAETVSALALSVLFFVLAIGIVTAPERTIGPASKLSNQLSTALLSLTNEGSVSNEGKAKTGASNQLFELLVLNPWTVLEFGGVEHCATVSHGKPQPVAVRPFSSNPSTDASLASRLEGASELSAGAKTCINDRNKYATHFLEFPPGSQRREHEHEALEHGDRADLPASDAGKTGGVYSLGPADEPAAESMDKGGQYQRLLLAIVIAIGELGAFLLLGALAVGVSLAQVLLLALLGFAPVALLIGIFPGRGHDFFRRWLAKLASYLARKVLYSLILAVLLAVCSALDSATSNLGWLLAFCLQAAFLWTVFLQRNKLTSDLLVGTLGPGAGKEGTDRLQALYYSTRLARMFASGRGVAGRSAGEKGHTASVPDASPSNPQTLGKVGIRPDGLGGLGDRPAPEEETLPPPTGEHSGAIGSDEEYEPGEGAKPLGDGPKPEAAEQSGPTPGEQAQDLPPAVAAAPAASNETARGFEAATPASQGAASAPTAPPEGQPLPLASPESQPIASPATGEPAPSEADSAPSAASSPTAEPIAEALRERNVGGPESTIENDASA